jgi:putative Mg2+ transporter-C (MgtC) family protein
MIDVQSICQLFLSVFLGAIMGAEREFKKKEAGLQTHSLVALGSCFFTMIALEMVKVFSQSSEVVFDPIRIIQAIAIGIGFIGAGVIFHQPSGVVGLTTSAGLWVAAAIGIAVGIKMYYLAIFATFLSLLVLFGFGLLEQKFFGGD